MRLSMTASGLRSVVCWHARVVIEPRIRERPAERQTEAKRFHGRDLPGWELMAPRCRAPAGVASQAGGTGTGMQERLRSETNIFIPERSEGSTIPA